MKLSNLCRILAVACFTNLDMICVAAVDSELSIESDAQVRSSAEKEKVVKGQSNSDLYVYVCTPDESGKDLNELEDMLESLISRMKSFINETKFIQNDFLRSSASLSSSITRISNGIGLFDPCNSKLISKIKFARLIHTTMKKAVESLAYFDLAHGRDHALVHKAIELNIKLLLLHDSRGIPDPTVESFGQKVVLYEFLLETWADLFRMDKQKPLSVLSMFEAQFKQAMFVIQDLKLYIPSSDTQEAS